MPRAPTRGALLAHVQHPHRQDHLPASGPKIAYQANRDGVAARGADPAVHPRLAVALALSGYSAALRRDGALPVRNTAKHHAAHTLSRLHPGPGLGQRLSLVLLDDIPDRNRCPQLQACAASGRLVTCAKVAKGTRAGTSGATIGTAPLPWAFSEAALLCLREQPPGQTCVARWEKTHDQENALTICAHPWARAV